MYKRLVSITLVLFSAHSPTYATPITKGHTSTPPVITLYQQPRFSFGLSFPQQKLPTTVFGLEQLHSYDHLRNRLDGNNSENNNTIFPGMSDILQQFNALNLQFKLKF